MAKDVLEKIQCSGKEVEEEVKAGGAKLDCKVQVLKSGKPDVEWQEIEKKLLRCPTVEELDGTNGKRSSSITLVDRLVKE